jgi:transposase-like protein
MNVHQNARLTPLSRADLVRRVLELGQPAGMVAFAFGICAKTVRKWVGRFQTEGSAGLADRSSRPSRLDRPTPPEQVETIIALRRQRLCGNHIAAQAGVSPATVSRVLQRAGSGRGLWWEVSLGFVLADEILNGIDAVLGESHDAVVVGAVDPDQTVFRFHADGDIGEPVFVDAELSGDQGQGADGVNLVALGGHAARISACGTQFQGSN